MADLHVIEKLGSKDAGDKHVQWDKDSKRDLEKVRALFEEKLKPPNNFIAYGWKKNVPSPFQLFEFDPACDRIVMRPPIIGG
jgi:hypothetical protein